MKDGRLRNERTLVANNFLAPLTHTEFSLIRLTPDGLMLEIQVTKGATYRIEASSDMSSWETLTTISAGSSTISQHEWHSQAI